MDADDLQIHDRGYPAFWLFSMHRDENFSGRSVLVILQDFHAKILMHNLAAMLVWVGQAIADRLYRHRRHSYQVNAADALSKMKNHLIRLLAQYTPWDLLLRLLAQIVDAVEAFRPDRSYPRDLRKIKLQGFQGNYKRTR